MNNDNPVTGIADTERPGLMRTDTLWKLLGRAHVLGAREDSRNRSRVLVLTSNLASAGSEGDKALRAFAALFRDGRPGAE